MIEPHDYGNPWLIPLIVSVALGLLLLARAFY